MDYFDKRVVLAVLLGCQAVAFLILANLSAYWQVIPYALLYGTAFGGLMPARGVIVSAFFAIIGALQVFDVIIPLTNGGPSNQTHTIVTYLYTFGLTRLNIGFGSAVGVILFVAAITVAVFYQRFFMKGDKA